VARAHVEIAKRGYAAINEAYALDSVDPLEPMLDEVWAEDGVLVTSGRLFPEAGEWPGKEGMLRFARQQMDAFERMWAEPDEYTDAGDRVLVRLRLGGVARHTGITMEFAIFHVFTFREDKLTRLEAHVDESDARRAAGLPAE
jgi:ketosteroid isomerase-like protein